MWRTLARGVLVAIALLTAFVGEPRAWGDDALWGRLRAEAPEGWKRIASLTAHLQMTLVRSGPDAAAAPSKSTFKVSGENFLYLNDNEAYCRNPRHSFQLRRQKPGDAWQIIRYDSTPNPELEGIFELLGAKAMALPQLRVVLVSLPEIFSQPTFVIKSVEEVKRDSKSLVEFSFEYAPPEGVAARAWPSSGRVVLDPAQSWVIVEQEVERTLASGGVWKWLQKNRLKLTPEKLPLFQGEQLELDIPGQSKMAITTEAQDVSTAEIPQKDFTLSALGVEEIDP